MVLARIAAVAAVLLHLSPSKPLNHLVQQTVNLESCREAELSVNVVAVLVDTDVAAIAYVGATLAAVIACRVLFPLSGQVHILAARD